MGPSGRAVDMAVEAVRGDSVTQGSSSAITRSQYGVQRAARVVRPQHGPRGTGSGPPGGSVIWGARQEIL